MFKNAPVWVPITLTVCPQTWKVSKAYLCLSRERECVQEEREREITATFGQGHLFLAIAKHYIMAILLWSGQLCVEISEIRDILQSLWITTMHIPQMKSCIILNTLIKLHRVTEAESLRRKPRFFMFFMFFMLSWAGHTLLFLKPHLRFILLFWKFRVSSLI